jgi:hypothetical protein
VPKLSVAIGLALVGATAAGLWVRGVYTDPREVAEMFRGYDLITLTFVAPCVLLLSLGPWQRRPRAQLVLASLLAYVVYNYALYVFGMRFNDLLLLHVALFSAGIFALIIALKDIDIALIARSFRDRTPTRSVATLLALLGVSLGGMWVAGAIGFVVSGDVPKEGSKLILPTELTHLAYVLDLSLLVPTYLLAAVLLWRRQTWGYVLAAVVLVAGVLHQLSYMTALVFQSNASISGATSFDPLEPIILGIYLVGTVLLLGNMGPYRAAPEAVR